MGLGAEPWHCTLSLLIMQASGASTEQRVVCDHARLAWHVKLRSGAGCYYDCGDHCEVKGQFCHSLSDIPPEACDAMGGWDCSGAASKTRGRCGDAAYIWSREFLKGKPQEK